jgi:hypothetical protein
LQETNRQGDFYSLDDAGVKFNWLVYIHIQGIRAMCQIFINPGDSLSNVKPLFRVDTDIFFLASLKGHDAVLASMLHKDHMVIQIVVKVFWAVATDRRDHIPVIARVFGLAG